MTTKFTKILFTVLAVWLLTSALCLPVFAQGTQFTYQGRLNDGTGPANGTYDLRFALFDALPVGNPVGSPVTNSPVNVSNGLFTVTLDFGNQFPGANRWLEIAVRTNGGGAFTALTPRQPITPTPYAITAGNLSGALPGASLSGTYSSPVTLNNVANNFAGSGANLTALNASQLTSGTVPTAALGNAWRIGGNVGTTPGTQFVGTTDNQPLELKVNNQRGLRLEPTAYLDTVNVIGGSAQNFVGAGVVGATISGGGTGDYYGGAYINRVEAHFGTVAGGFGHTIQTDAVNATIGGGVANIIAATSRTATIAGGWHNAIGTNSIESAIGGGSDNTIAANSPFATIAGGYGNAATGYAFAAGRRAKANHTGAFVWADSTDADFASTAANQFLIRANGGVGIGTGNPQGSLHVYSAFNPTVVRIQSGGTPGFGRLEFVSDPQSSGTEWRPGYIQSLDAGGFTGGLGFYVNGAGADSKFGDTEVLRLINGRVGINQPNPAYTLDVNGWANMLGLVAGDMQSSYLSTSFLSAGDIDSSGTLTFHGDYRQMVTLGESGFVADGPGFGLQTNNVYLRSDGDFSWFRGGAHSSVPHDPGGLLGVEMMRLSGGYLNVTGEGNEQAYLGGDGAGGDVEIGSRNAAIMNVGFWNAAAFSHMNLYALTFNPVSDRNQKQDFKPVDAREILNKVIALPVTEWTYKADAQTRHLGPVAQDFQAAFGLGASDKSIATVDADGVALAAIQGLNQKVDAENAGLRAENAALKRELSEIKQLLVKLSNKKD